MSFINCKHIRFVSLSTDNRLDILACHVPTRTHRPVNESDPIDVMFIRNTQVLLGAPEEATSFKTLYALCYQCKEFSM